MQLCGPSRGERRTSEESPNLTAFAFSTKPAAFFLRLAFKPLTSMRPEPSPSNSSKASRSSRLCSSLRGNARAGSSVGELPPPPPPSLLEACGERAAALSGGGDRHRPRCPRLSPRFPQARPGTATGRRPPPALPSPPPFPSARPHPA